MRWVVGNWEIYFILVVFGWVFYKYLMGNKQDDGDGGNRRVQPPRGSSGWPVIGETIEFIAAGYTSRPVTFMEKRKSM